MTPPITTWAIALALLAAQTASAAQATQAAAEAPAAAPTQPDRPAGAPQEDYPFVAWCYGALRGYLDLHDEVMPEVTRIETTYRAPGRKLSDDLKVYADMQRDGRAQLPKFAAALTAAEKASPRPLNAQGAEAIKKGRGMWVGGPGVTKARLAQEWMSWVLPARCETAAKDLTQRAALMGPAFQVNVDPPAEAATEAPPTAGTSPAEGPVADPAPAAEPASPN